MLIKFKAKKKLR